MSNLRRIVWYTGKVAAWTAVSPAKAGEAHKRRGKRLHNYKLALNERLTGGN